MTHYIRGTNNKCIKIHLLVLLHSAFHLNVSLVVLIYKVYIIG